MLEIILVRVFGWVGGHTVIIRLNSVQLQLPAGTELGNSGQLRLSQQPRAAHALRLDQFNRENIRHLFPITPAIWVLGTFIEQMKVSGSVRLPASSTRYRLLAYHAQASVSNRSGFSLLGF